MHFSRTAVDVVPYGEIFAPFSACMPIIIAVSKRDFKALQKIADEYGLDFRPLKHAVGDYPEILCSQTLKKAPNIPTAV